MTAAFHTRESLLVTGSIALGAVRELVRQREGELRRQFPSFLVDSAETLLPEAEEGQKKMKRLFWQPSGACTSHDQELSGRFSGQEPGRNEGMGTGTADVRPLGPGGIFNALWDTCEMYGAGAVIDIKKIPVRQETIEILEYFDLNPYYADSAGASLLVTADGAGTVFALREAGIEAAQIGFLTDGKARTIRYGEHTRYLDRPQLDEFARWENSHLFCERE